MIIRDAKQIIEFLKGDGKDYRDRTFQDIIGCSDSTMEKCHDQIQWMFPLHEESAFASTYPIITKDIVEESKRWGAIKENLVKAKTRMERFYAIGNYHDKDIQRKWCNERNHNLLRITRIIRCLRIFELDGFAENFYLKALLASKEFLMDDSLTFSYWKKALREDVWNSLR